MSSRDVSAIDHSIAATLSLEASSIALSAPPASGKPRGLFARRSSRLEVLGGDTTENADECEESDQVIRDNPASRGTDASRSRLKLRSYDQGSDFVDLLC